MNISPVQLSSRTSPRHNVITLVVAVIVGFGLLAYLSLHFLKVGTNVEPIRVQSFGYPSQHLPEEAMPLSSWVVRARITKAGEGQWNTPDGLRPNNWNVGMVDKTAIYTPYFFEVEEVLWGNAADLSGRSFAVVGGEVNGDSLQMMDGFQADVAVGDEVILFLRPAAPDRAHIAAYGFVDALRVEGDKAVASCHDRPGIENCVAVFELSDFIARVKGYQNDVSQ